MARDTHMKIYFHEADKFPYQPISPIWMTVYSLLSFLFFFCIDRYVTTSILHDKPKKSTWSQRNTLLSFIHSSLSSVFVVIAFLRAPEVMDDPFSHGNYFNYAIAAFTLGYFFWDFIDCKQNSPSSLLGILIHHIVAIWFLCYVLFNTVYLGYTLYGLSLEINSVFLHARRLLRWFSPKLILVGSEEKLCTFVMIGNYLTFLIFRFGVLGVCIHALYYQRYRISAEFYVGACLSAASVFILNLVLLYRLITNDFKISLKFQQNRTKDSATDQPADEMFRAN